MSKQQENESWIKDKALNYIYINEVIFIFLVFLCFVGELLAEFTDRIAFLYWFSVTPIFFYCSWLSEQAKAITTGVKNEHLIRYELFYWGSAMVGVILIFIMWHSDSIKASSAAMSIHILLAHTMFLSGIVLGLHYYLVGGFLFVTAALSIIFGGMFGLTIVLAIPFLWLGFYMEKTYVFPVLKRKHDFTKELNNDENERRYQGD